MLLRGPTGQKVSSTTQPPPSWTALNAIFVHAVEALAILKVTST